MSRGNGEPAERVGYHGAVASPFDNFEQQIAVHEWLQAHGPRLAKQAAQLRQRDASVRHAGLIADPECPESRGVRLVLRRAGHTPDDGPIAGLMERDKLVRVLANVPAALHWFEENDRPDDQLTIAVFAKDGMRIARLPIPDD